MHEKDYERFEKLENAHIRQDILEHIEKKEDGYYFRNREDGSCFMLDEDGLCRIQRNMSEKTLCGTCRKYPRIIGEMEGVTYLSMAASCPVISKMLVEGKVQWQRKEEGKVLQAVQIREHALVKPLFHSVLEGEELAYELQCSKKNTELVFYGFEKMCTAVLDIMIRYKEGNYLLDDLKMFEQEILYEEMQELLDVFLEETQEEWGRIYRNYMDYAVLTKSMERSVVDEFVLKQVYGELLLVRTLAFGRYCQKGLLLSSDWQEILQKTYRFCVHGKAVRKEITALFQSFFTKMFAWNYVLWSNKSKG